MVEKYKVAYPAKGHLNSRMFQEQKKAIIYSKNNPFSMTMELKSMDDFGNYSWRVINIGPGWILILIAIVFAIIK